MRLAPGTRLGPYEIVAMLGAGGMGEVYRARDSRLERQVAIKVMHDALIGPSSEGWERFQREARAAAALNHPHICAVFDVGEADGRPYLVMELIEGPTLRELIGASGVDTGTAVRMMIQVADALAAAHGKGVVHRDIKPGNIMVTGGRHVKVLDFGLAKYAVVDDGDGTRTVQALTETGSMLGTPHYMAPELFQGRSADVRSDLWSVGVVIYQMLSGQLPFNGGTAFEVGSAVLRESAPPLAETIPSDLRTTVDRLLAKSPENRIQRAADLRDALELMMTPTPGHAGAQHGRPDARKLTVTGAPASPHADANDAFTLAAHFLRVQNDLVRGQKQIERALAIDPHFAEARRFHAFNQVILLLNGYVGDPTILYEAEEELREAERQDPTLASLPAAFAALYLTQGRKDMAPALVFDDSAVSEIAARDIIVWRAIVALLEGDLPRTKRLTRESLDRDPMFGAPRMFLAEALREEGDVAGAIRETRRILEQAPANISAVWWLTLALADAGDLGEAETLLESYRGAFTENFLWRIARALVFACQGRAAEAHELLNRETLKFAGAVFVVTLEIAEIYALLGDGGQAVDWIETAVRNGDERVEWFRRSPRLASIQKDARFTRILQSLEARQKRRRTPTPPM